MVARGLATGVAGGMAELDPPQLVTPTECIDGSLEVSPSTCSAIFAARDVQLTTALPVCICRAQTRHVHETMTSLTKVRPGLLASSVRPPRRWRQGTSHADKCDLAGCFRDLEVHK